MSQLFYTLPKRITVSPSPPLLHFNYRSSRTRLVCSKMPTESSPWPLTHSITIPSQLSQPVHVVAAPGLSESDFRCAVESTLFKQWLKNLQSETGILANGDMLLKHVLIQGVDMFGKRIGFLKFKADIFCKETGQKVRVPTGRVILELPAGMLDDDKGDFVGTAVREVEEETGIQLKLEDMIDLTAFLYPSTGCKFFPSPGGCDEEISLFLYRGRVDKEIIMQLQGKETGLRDHGELIKVRVVPYRELWRTTPDAKVLTAIALYEMASKEELLPSRT